VGGADEGDAEGEEAARRGKQPVDYQAEDNLCGELEEPVEYQTEEILYALSRGGRREGSEERGAGEGGGREQRREEQGRPEAGSRG
jgi:hypothetical protein